jgi:hypothetical protein
MFELGEVVSLKPDMEGFAAREGARARIVGFHCPDNGTHYVVVQWERDGLDKGQMDGMYYPSSFQTARGPW